MNDMTQHADGDTVLPLPCLELHPIVVELAAELLALEPTTGIARPQGPGSERARRRCHQGTAQHAQGAGDSDTILVGNVARKGSEQTDRLLRRHMKLPAVISLLPFWPLRSAGHSRQRSVTGGISSLDEQRPTARDVRIARIRWTCSEVGRHTGIGVPADASEAFIDQVTAMLAARSIAPNGMARRTAQANDYLPGLLP